MIGKEVATGCFTPIVKSVNNTCYKAFVLLIALCVLSGCATSTVSKSKPLALAPPEIRFTSLYYEEQSAEAAMYLTDPQEQEKPNFNTKDLLKAVSKAGIAAAGEKNFSKSEKDKGCRLKSRFDRDAVLAYEWGQQGRNRLSFDVDGVDIKGSDDQMFKIQYKLRIQPEKPKKQRCRYDSQWQGMIGSGYNEFFLRKEDTVWQELRQIRQEVKEYLNNRF